MLPELSAEAAATYKGVKAWCRDAKEAASTSAEKECVCAIKAAAQEGKATFDPRNPNAAAAAKRCLLYTSPSPRDATLSRMPSSA